MKKVSYNKYHGVLRTYRRDLTMNTILLAICVIGLYIGYMKENILMRFIFSLLGVIFLIFDIYLLYFMNDYKRNYRPKNRIRDMGNITISEMDIPEPTKVDKNG